MKMSCVTRVFTMATLVTIVIVASCKKDNSAAGTQAEKEEFATVTSESDAEAEVVFDDVFDNVMGVNDEVAIGGTGVFGRVAVGSNTVDDSGNRLTGTDSTCFAVSITQVGSTRFPLKVVIDFGAGCTGKDGRIRKGKIIAVYTGRLILPGNAATITFDGYGVNDISVEGTYKITNTSTQNKKSFTTQVIGARLSKPNGNFTQWNSEKTVAQIEGLGTPFLPLDDWFEVSGQANGAVKRGDRYFQWSTVINQPLLKKYLCRWIVKGTITLSKSNTAVAVLDYGSGSCDNKATFSVNGTAREITLR
jgi:hypothetical protein